jgi:hypothetical protein
LHGKLLIMKFLYKLTTVRDISAGDMWIVWLLEGGLLPCMYSVPTRSCSSSSHETTLDLASRGGFSFHRSLIAYLFLSVSIQLRWLQIFLCFHGVPGVSETVPCVLARRCYFPNTIYGFPIANQTKDYILSF